MKIFFLIIVIVALFSGCVSFEESPPVKVIPRITSTPTPTAPPTPSPIETTPSVTPIIHIEEEVGFNEKSHAQSYEDKSVAVEVDYREYVDWFRNHNLFIRSYTPFEYVCGQYTTDMIDDSIEEGFNVYYAAVTFKDGTGHALVSFKSSSPGFTSWYFFEPQTNNLITPESLDSDLNRAMGKKVDEVNIYGYYDDAEDADPTTWRFMYPLYNKKY